MTKVPILMYHSIDDSPSAACVRPPVFDKQMAYLHNRGYKAINLDDLYNFLTEGASLPSKPIIITFDDGYRDNMENAYPILKRYGMCATIFLPTGHMGFSNRWSASEGTPQRPLLTWTDVQSLAADPLISFQSHTCTHPRLTHIPTNLVGEEFKRSKVEIEDRLGRPCHHIAYPYGDFNISVRDIAEQAGFRTACSTQWGHNRPGHDLFAMCRIGISNQARLSEFKRVLGEPPALWRYYWLRLKSRVGLEQKKNKG